MTSSFVVSLVPWLILLIAGVIIIRKKERAQAIRLRDVNASVLNLIVEQGTLSLGVKAKADIEQLGDHFIEYKDCTNFLMSTVGGEIAKGYDCFIVKHLDSNTVVEKHKHRHSSELFFVISGQLAIRLQGGSVTNVLGPMMSLYVPRKMEHSLQALVPNTIYLVIAKPPVINFFRGGDLCERFFKCFRNSK